MKEKITIFGAVEDTLQESTQSAARVSLKPHHIPQAT